MYYLVALAVRMGSLGLINPSDSTDAEYSASIKVSAPLVSKIEAQSHETPDEAEVQRLVYATRKEKDDGGGGCNRQDTESRGPGL